MARRYTERPIEPGSPRPRRPNDSPLQPIPDPFGHLPGTLRGRPPVVTRPIAGGPVRRPTLVAAPAPTRPLSTTRPVVPGAEPITGLPVPPLLRRR